MKPTSHYLNVNGIKTHWLDFGSSTLPSIVCLHGLSRNAYDFYSIGKALSSYYHVRAVDFRGRGESGWGPREQYVLPVYVKDLLTLLDCWGVTKTSLIGSSMGGLISILLASKYPSLVSKIALNDIGPEFEPLGLKRIVKTSLEAPMLFLSQNSVVSYFRKYFPPIAKVGDDVVWEFALSSIKPKKEGGWEWKMDPAVRAAIEVSKEAVAPDLWKEFKSCRCDFLVLRGVDSDLLSRRICQKMLEVHPNCHWVEVPGVGHTPLLTEPIAVSALMNFFVDSNKGHQEGL